jgi:hypothetical protein
MNMRPQIRSSLVYSDPNKKLLKEWIWKTYQASLIKDHRTLVSVTGAYVGFICKSGTFYYAVIINDRSGRAF